MIRPTLLTLALIALAAPAAARGFSPAKAERFLDEFRSQVEKLNKAHLASPGGNTEEDLAEKLPGSFRKGLDQILDMEDGVAKWTALVTYAEIAADMDLVAEIEKAEAALAKGSTEHAGKLGIRLSRPRFVLHGLRVRREFAERFAEVLEGMLVESDRVFGFAEFSKVPGKKLRVELHREERPRPPHFAPQFPFHSAIDFPVASDEAFVSPTRDGKFYFYGLGHELGHVMAMWGDRRTMEDHHAWAHYVGIVLVTACSERPWAKGLRDQRWRSVEVDARKLSDAKPGRSDRDGVLKLLLELHRLVGAKTIGAGLNLMEEKGTGHRINRVRYYGLADLENALLSLTKSRAKKKRIKALFQ